MRIASVIDEHDDIITQKYVDEKINEAIKKIKVKGNYLPLNEDEFNEISNSGKLDPLVASQHKTGFLSEILYKSIHASLNIIHIDGQVFVQATPDTFILASVKYNKIHNNEPIACLGSLQSYARNHHGFVFTHSFYEVQDFASYDLRFITNENIIEIFSKMNIIVDISNYITLLNEIISGVTPSFIHYLFCGDLMYLTEFINFNKEMKKLQPKGDYITKSELNDKGYITEPIADNKYQPIGDYVTNNTLIGKKYIDENKLNNRGFITEVKADGRYQVKGNYITESELTSKDYITKASASSLYQAKGDYVTNTSINNKLGNYVKTTDLKANTVPTSDGSSNVEAEINSLKSKTTDLKPSDFKSNNKNKLITNIEFNSASKTLNISYVNNETSGIENLSIPYTTTGDLVDTKIDTHLSKKLNTVLDEILNKQSNIVATDIKGNTDKKILTSIKISTTVLSLFFINENGVRTKEDINISFFANKDDIKGCVKPNLLQGSFSEKYMFKIINNPDSYYKRKIGTFNIDDIERTPIITLSCTIEWDNLEYLNYSSFSMYGEGVNNPNLVIMGGEFKITKNSGHVRHVSTITIPSNSITEDNRSFDFYILCKYIRNGNINISDTKIEEGEQYTPHILYQPDIYTKNNLPSSKMIGFNLLQSQDYLDNGLIGSVKDLNSNFKVDIVSVTGIKITKISNTSEKIRVCRIKTDGLQSGLQDIELKRNHQAIISWSCNIYSSKYMNIHSMGLSSLGNAGYNYNIKSIDTECNIYKTFMFNMKDNTVYFDIFIDDNMKQGDWIIIKDLKIEEGPPTPIENDLKFIDNKMNTIDSNLDNLFSFISETLVSRSEFEEFKNSLK